MFEKIINRIMQTVKGKAIGKVYGIKRDITDKTISTGRRVAKEQVENFKHRNDKTAEEEAAVLEKQE